MGHASAVMRGSLTEQERSDIIRDWLAFDPVLIAVLQIGSTACGQFEFQPVWTENGRTPMPRLTGLQTEDPISQAS
jgi:hypothetical protein